MDDAQLEALRRKALERSAEGKAIPPEEWHVLYTELLHQNEEMRDSQINLENSRRRFRQLFEFAPIGYAEIDAQGVILTANLQAVETLGLPMPDGRLLPTAVVRWFDDGSHGDWAQHLKTIFGNRGSATVTVESRGRSRLLRITSRFFIDETDGAKGVCLSAIQDVTAERDLQAMKEAMFRKKSEEIRRAQEIQAELFTSALPLIPGVSLAGFSLPSEELGGDLLVVEKAEDRIFIVAADCVGHGLEASLFSAFLKAQIDQSMDLLRRGEPSAFVQRLNRECHRAFKHQNYPELFAAVFEGTSRRLVFANANFPLPFLYGNGQSRRLDRVEGFFLGFDPEMTFEEKTVYLDEGQGFLLASDALTEIPAGASLAYDERAILDLCRGFGRGAHADLGELCGAVTRVHPLPLPDDATFLFVQAVSRTIGERTERRDEDPATVNEPLPRVLTGHGYAEEEVTRLLFGADLIREWLGTPPQGVRTWGWDVDTHRVALTWTLDRDEMPPALALLWEKNLGAEALSMALHQWGERRVFTPYLLGSIFQEVRTEGSTWTAIHHRPEPAVRRNPGRPAWESALGDLLQPAALRVVVAKALAGEKPVLRVGEPFRRLLREDMGFAALGVVFPQGSD